MATPAPLPLLERPQVAELLSVKSPTRISKWELEGLPVAEPGKPGKASKYAQAAVVAWHVAREVARARGTGEGGLDPAAERARKDRAQAELAEQMLASRGGALVPADEIKRAWAQLVIAAKSKLLALPRALAARLLTIESAPEIEALLRQHIVEALAELSSGQTGPPAARARERGKRTRR
jgi:phage terminase Nu1 subunit (DNA packaging protein)